MSTKKTIISIIKYVVTLSVAFGLLWYAFRGISISDMISKLGSVDFGWIYLSIGLSILSHLMRAYRWQILLQPLDYHININRSFWAVMIGYLANLAFPRMGEITKCGVLKKTDGVKVSSSMGTVVTERIFDVIMLLITIGITFLVEFDRLNQFFIELFTDKFSALDIALLQKTAIILLLLMLIGVATIYLLRNRILQSSLFQKVWSLVLSFKEGILSVQKINNVPGFLISTVGIWVLYYLMAYVIVFSVPETSGLNWMAGLAILVVSGLAMSTPVQGGIGTFHFLIAALLTLYGIERDQGVFFATLMHTSQTITVLLFGGIGLIVVTFLKRHELDSAE